MMYQKTVTWSHDINWTHVLRQYELDNLVLNVKNKTHATKSVFQHTRILMEDTKKMSTRTTLY